MENEDKQFQVIANEVLINRFKNFCNVRRLKYRDTFEKAIAQYMDAAEGIRLERQDNKSKKLVTSQPADTLEALQKELG